MTLCGSGAAVEVENRWKVGDEVRIGNGKILMSEDMWILKG
jgi:hypothetical protein